MSEAGLYLRSIRFQGEDLPEAYPFSIPAIATLERIELRSPVTFFAGENGTGKSTLLEGIAVAARAIPVRSEDALTEATLAHAEELARYLRLTWSRRPAGGFFLRSEDFFDYAKRLAGLAREMEETADEFGERFEGYGLGLARGAVLGQRDAIIQKYAGDLNARSHGESFLQFFRSRFTGEGLYLLDEPDTALSPQSVLGLLAMIKEMVEAGGQFIIATHHPMLLAYPGASIVSFDRYPVAEIPYDRIEQIELMRRFLERPDAFLRHL